MASMNPSPTVPGEKEKEEKSDDPPLSFFTAVELQVLKNFVDHYSVNKELTREDCIALDYTFGQVFQQCLDMIDEELVVIRRSPVSGRTLIQVFGKRETYWIPPGHSICQCMAYTHGKKEYCKHVLAGHLLLALSPKEKYKTITEEELVNIFTDYFSV